MNPRRSIDIPGLHHQNPIPMASRIGPILMTGAVYGRDPKTGTAPPDIESQCVLMFASVRTILELAGGTPDNIVKMNVWLKDKQHRPHVNKVWIEMFPDPQSRPARHTSASDDFPEGHLVQCDVMAVIPE
jgi:2-iminobutanoate/2-iminopropanoate deaminase